MFGFSTNLSSATFNAQISAKLQQPQQKSIDKQFKLYFKGSDTHKIISEKYFYLY